MFNLLSANTFDPVISQILSYEKGLNTISQLSPFYQYPEQFHEGLSLTLAEIQC